MRACFKKCSLKGKVQAPPSKSMAHRYLILSYLSGEKCKVSNIAFSEDIKATLNCLKGLGASLEMSENEVLIQKTDSDKIPVLNCNESGSTLRFLIPIALTLDKEVTFTGTEKLFSRPLDIYEKLCSEKGFLFRKENDKLTVKGKLSGGSYTVRGDISSQFISGLLFALSLIPEESVINVLPPFESKSYVLMTAQSLNEFGIKVDVTDRNIRITGGKYVKRDSLIEGDYSNAAYIEGFNLADGNCVEISGLSKSIQGDRVYKKLFEKLENFSEIDISDCPDLGPVLFVGAALKCGATFKGTKRLAAKESDRVSEMAEELKKFGIKVEWTENSATVEKGNIRHPDCDLSSHNDHRVLMALSILLSVTGGTITGAEAVKKSFPNYFEKIKQLGAEVKLTDDSRCD